MTPLRQPMLEDMQVRNLSTNTQRAPPPAKRVSAMFPIVPSRTGLPKIAAAVAATTPGSFAE